MSVHYSYDTAAFQAAMPRSRDVQPRAADPLDPIARFTREELRQIVMELMG